MKLYCDICGKETSLKLGQIHNSYLYCDECEQIHIKNQEEQKKKEETVAFVKLECPICHSVRDRLIEDVDGIDIWCRDCKNWFEIGFQIHSED